MRFFNANPGTLTYKIYKNILFTLPVKGGSALITLAMIPLLYNFLNPEVYGIWILIFTIFNWIGLIDLGLADGLKNRLVSALTISDYQLAREYVSTSYVAIAVISGAIFLLLLVPIFLLDWPSWFNIPKEIELTSISVLVCGLFAVRFTLQSLASVLTANHEVYKVDLINFISSILVITQLIVMVGFDLHKGSLLAVVLVNMLTPIIVFTAASIYLYTGKLRNISPSLSLFRLQHLKSLLHLGFNFLWIKINGIILLQSAYLIISATMGPSVVTTYSIVFNYFNSIQVILNVFINPYWPAVTEAATKNDYNWISANLKNVRWMILIFSVACIAMYLLSDILIPLWIGKVIHLNESFVLLMCIYIMLNMWKGVYSFFLNGMGIVKIQSIVASATAICFLALSFPLIGIYGLTGIVLANVIAGTPRAIIFPITLGKHIR